MIYGKRAGDWLPALISGVLLALLVLVAILLFYNIAGNIEAHEFTPLTGKLRYDILSARILNSPDCLALEETYVDLETNQKFQTHAGIIDYNKLVGENLGSCMRRYDGGFYPYSILLEDLDGDWDISSSNEPSKIRFEDKFLIKVYRNGEFHNGILTIGLL